MWSTGNQRKKINMNQKRLTVILSSALAVAVLVAVFFLTPLSSIITGTGEAAKPAASGQVAKSVDNDNAAGEQALEDEAATDAAAATEANPEGSSTNAEPATQVGTTQSSSQSQANTMTCYLSIECGQILGDMGNLKPEKKAYVPANGLILDTTAVTLEPGQTVLNALQTGTRNNGIQMDTNGAGATAYIRGIANIYERDCGPLSGWKYYVNGVSQGVGCGQVELHDGDVVSWYFSLSV
jgi:hypothetical protein